MRKAHKKIKKEYEKSNLHIIIRDGG